jgi:hypothetical protein
VVLEHFERDLQHTEINCTFQSLLHYSTRRRNIKIHTRFHTQITVHITAVPNAQNDRMVHVPKQTIERTKGVEACSSMSLTDNLSL